MNKMIVWTPLLLLTSLASTAFSEDSKTSDIKQYAACVAAAIQQSEDIETYCLSERQRVLLDLDDDDANRMQAQLEQLKRKIRLEMSRGG